MKYLLPLIFIISLLSVFSFSANHPEKYATDSPVLPPSIVTIDTDTTYQYLGHKLEKELLSKSGCPGAALVIVKDSSIVYMDGFGVRKVNTSDSVDINTIFRIGSLSKGFAGILTGLMIEKSDINWDTKIREHVPEFVLSNNDQASKVEVRHLLSHTTGLPLHSYTNLLEAGMDINTIMPRLKTVNLIGAEGQIMSYQNVAFAIVEEVIQSALNKDFGQLLHDELFVPANMQRSSCSFDAIATESNLAMPHSWSSKYRKYYSTKLNKKYYNAPSAGGINTSIADMGEWLQVLLGNRPDIVPLQVLDSVFTPEVSTTRDRKYFNKWPNVQESHYAKGWRMVKFDNRTIIHHGGYVNNYRSEIALDRENKLGICVLFNAPTRYASRVVPTFFSLCDSLATNGPKDGVQSLSSSLLDIHEN